MSRTVKKRWELTGQLVAQTPIHVGGLGDGSVLVSARDGQGRPIIPGTSLTGAIRSALKVEEKDLLWGVPPEGGSSTGGTDGSASWVRMDDAVAQEPTVVQIQEHVSIDRVHGVAAQRHLYSREVMAAGTRMAFRLVVDDPNGVDGRAVVQRVAGLLRGPGLDVGAASTRGLGRVRLREAELREHDLCSRDGMIRILRGQATLVELAEPQPDAPGEGILRVSIPWRPVGPLAVHVSVGGDAVDAFPYARIEADRVRLELPGSSIKGVLRSHAERIVRTLTGADAPEKFLDQMRADGLGPVAALFGTAGDAGRNETGWRGALRFHGCLSQTSIPAQPWEDVRLLKRRVAEEPSKANDEKAALGRLQASVDDLNEQVSGVRFVIAPHVAVDRWTGGAADGLLFATLEPHATGDGTGAWEPIVLDLDTTRIGTAPDAALALILLVLRDLCEGWIAFGHATTRGMGAVAVDLAAVRFEAGPQARWATELSGQSLAEVLNDEALTERLARSWKDTVTTLGSAA